MDIPDLELERALWDAGVRRVVGEDEVGRGCTAGAVCAAAVLWSPDAPPIAGVRDSKQLSARRRELLAAAILDGAVAVGIGAASVREIDATDILVATRRAMARAVVHAGPVDHVLVDGLPMRGFEAQVGPYTAVVHGDARCWSIAAASIVAKVVRDRLMARLALRHPGYGWERNAGYGTAEHLAGLAALGPTAHHRRTFAPVTRLLERVADGG